MKDKRLIIQINKPVTDVFEFTTNPKNTPLWIASIAEEIVNESPVRLGTIYKNRNYIGGKWTEYIVTEFELNKTFTFKM